MGGHAVTLSTGERDSVYRAFMRLVVAEPCTFTKGTLRAAVDDVDNWCDAAATTVPPTSYNAALNATFRSAATASQKANLLGLVALYRGGRTVPEGS